MRHRRAIAALAGLVALMTVVLALCTGLSLRTLPATLDPSAGGVSRPMLLDRHGAVLSRTYGDDRNVQDVLALHEVPALLRDAFVDAEDRRFLEHRGVDWRARVAAVWQNVRAGRAVRGASTISEQVVRMLHGRPRTLWSRWVEGFEAGSLERRFGKAEILEFYLNQVPYAARRRGVRQASRYWFDREPDTLSPREMLALAVMVRSPGRLDPRRSGELDPRIDRLARRMHEAGTLDDSTLQRVLQGRLELGRAGLEVEAPHFVHHVRDRWRGDRLRLTTTLDGALHQRAQAILENQIRRLADRDVGDGAVLIVDHRSDEVLAWVNAGDFVASEGGQIDAVLAARQPGSTLKPFLYACAIETGWTAATTIDDSPLAEAVGAGLHRFRNYGRVHYGPLRLRLALANSLNVPAVRAIRHVSVQRFLHRLRELGFASLDRHPDVYGEGLALGNGEVTLLELVDAYATLARGGLRRPLRLLSDDAPGVSRRVFEADVATLIGDALADPEARALEFGRGGILELPFPAAVKTGTSNDYRDAWAVGFSSRHVVGVWMGNLDRRPMRGVSGATGPAVVLRSVFAELARGRQPGRLPLSRRLRRAEVCADSGGIPTPACPRVREWFRPEAIPEDPCGMHERPVAATVSTSSGFRLKRPTPGLHLALDPRIPDDLEAFAFEVEIPGPPRPVRWVVDGITVGETDAGVLQFPWKPVRGEHEVRARIAIDNDEVETAPIRIVVR